MFFWIFFCFDCSTQTTGDKCLTTILLHWVLHLFVLITCFIQSVVLPSHLEQHESSLFCTQFSWLTNFKPVDTDQTNVGQTCRWHNYKHTTGPLCGALLYTFWSHLRSSDPIYRYQNHFWSNTLRNDSRLIDVLIRNWEDKGWWWQSPHSRWPQKLSFGLKMWHVGYVIWPTINNTAAYSRPFWNESM